MIQLNRHPNYAITCLQEPQVSDNRFRHLWFLGGHPQTMLCWLLLSSAVPNSRPYLCSFWRLWHPRSIPERTVRNWTRWCGAGSCGTGRSPHHSPQKSDLGLSCHCSHIFYKCFQLAKGSHSNQGRTWKEEQHRQWWTMTFLSAAPFFLWPYLCYWELIAVCSGQRAH